MATSATSIIPVEEYLATSYEPECEYLDGEVRQKAMPDSDHSRMQALFVGGFLALERRYQIWTLPEARVMVRPTRARVPDVCIVRGPARPPRLLTEPPLLCIEIISPTDTSDDLQDRVDDYLAMGVPCVWVVNPRTRRGWMYTSDGIKEAKDGILHMRNPDISIPIPALFD